MRPIVIVLVAVALGIAGITAVLMSRYFSDQQAQTLSVPLPVGPPTEDVLVAAGDIKAGALVKADDLRYQAWPAKGIDGRLVRRGEAGADSKAGFVGTIARRSLLAGEPLTPQAVFRQDEAGVMAGLLSPGLRAVAVPVTAASGVAGFIQPNDRVDVVLNQDMKAVELGNQEIHGDFQRLVTEVVLSDVRVLAVDDKLVKPDAAANLPAKAVILEVSPKDAEILVTALKMGEITLTLRSMAAGEGDGPSAGYTSDLEISRALRAALGGHGSPDSRRGGTAEVRVNRAGATTTQSFSN